MSKAKKKLKHGTRDFAAPKSAVSLARWDSGADGPANWGRAKRLEDAIDTSIDPDTGEVKNQNPNGVKRMRYYTMLDVYAKRGWISAPGHEAGKRLRNVWEATEKGVGNDWSKERVDKSPKPDAAIAIQIDRVSKLVGITRKIPADDYRILMFIACEDLPIGRLKEYRGINHDKGKAHMRAAFDRLADRLGL